MRAILSLTALCLCFVVASDVEALQRKKQRVPQPKASPPQQSTREPDTTTHAGEQPGPSPLDRLTGTWDMTAGFAKGVLSLGDGRLTRSSFVTIYRYGVLIDRPKSDTLTFSFNEDSLSLKRDASDVSVTLKRDVASKTYILTAKKGEDPVIDNTAFTYSEKDGFSSPDSAPAGDEPRFSPKITFDDTGGHTWLIKSNFNMTFVKPK